MATGYDVDIDKVGMGKKTMDNMHDETNILSDGNTQDTIGGRISKARETAQLSLSTAAKLAGVRPNTLKSWEEKGLKRLEPPIEGTRTVYYKLENVLQFLEK